MYACVHACLHEMVSQTHSSESRGQVKYVELALK